MVQQDGATHESRFLPSHPFLSTIGGGRQFVSFKKEAIIFAQGDTTQAVFFIKKGKVKVSVVSPGGKEAILGILGEHDFVGECSLAGGGPRMSFATALTDCSLLRIEKKAMSLAMNQDSGLATLFIQYLLGRNLRHQEALVDQFFNSTEKRLVRALLLLADSGKKTASGTVVPRLPQETLAKMVGTTRSRISFFLNRFRKLGLIHYRTGKDLHVHCSLLQAALGHGQLQEMLPMRRVKEPKHMASRLEQHRALESAA